MPWLVPLAPAGRLLGRAIPVVGLTTPFCCRKQSQPYSEMVLPEWVMPAEALTHLLPLAPYQPQAATERESCDPRPRLPQAGALPALGGLCAACKTHPEHSL